MRTTKTETETKTIGRFTYDYGTGTLSGPADYMSEQGNRVLDAILRGENTVANYGMSRIGEPGFAPDVPTAVMVAIQTDYAGWAGMRSFLAARA